MVELTEAAAIKIRSILTEEEEGLKLRLYIIGGGCSGFQYGFSLDKGHPDDVEASTLGMTLVVDPISINYLAGSRVDFKEDLMGSAFVISNPNAKSTCGCGSSFAA